MKRLKSLKGWVKDYEEAESLLGDAEVLLEFQEAGEATSKVDTDVLYEINAKKCAQKGDRPWTLFRGHIPQLSEQDHIFSLEEQAFEKGHLVLMRYDDFLGRKEDASPQKAFKSSCYRMRSEFSFKQSKNNTALMRSLESLVTQKLVTRSQSGPLVLYKYSRNVFYDNLWHTDAVLMKARGVVMDLGGAVVSHPFDKVFNFSENGAGTQVSHDAPVIAIEKLNGFLGIVSRHPFKKGELLVTTQGSFEGAFVDYVKEYLNDASVRPGVSRFLGKHNVTLCFEVLHPQDPHIVEYPSTMHGLHLIGVRDNQELAQSWKEEQVDAAAKEMGLRRPAWARTTFGAAMQAVASSVSEGIMLRHDDDQQDFICKVKSPHYLCVKLLGRLSVGNMRHMYANTRSFKQKVDEEFYEIVDNVINKFSEEEFVSFSEAQRVSAVREIILSARAHSNSDVPTTKRKRMS